MKTLTFGLIASLMLTSSALAHGVTAGDIEIIHPNIPQPAASAQAAAGYMGISNSGHDADKLIAIETPAAQSAMLHGTEHGTDGVARMVPLEGLEIPAGDTVVLEPGGMHVMLMGLTGPLTEGQMVPGVLVFEKAGRVEMEFMVDPASGADHSTMDHAAMGHDAAAGHDAHSGHAAPAPAMTGDDVVDIEALLKAQFDTPDNPLTVAPITVQGSVAIAGWAQGGNGGRAFMRKDEQGWFVEMCAGAGLMLPETLQGLGLSAAEAETLLANAKAAEHHLGAETIALFDSFDGTLMIGRQGHGQSN